MQRIFKAVIEKVPFHILEIFHHKDDTLWEQLFKDISKGKVLRHYKHCIVELRELSLSYLGRCLMQML